MRTIGLLLGSFNPVHYGHIGVAKNILRLNLVEEVWFVLSPQNPFKNKKDLLEDNLRLQILRLALEEYSSISVSDIELYMDKPSYTYKTLRKFKNDFPKNKFSLILGSDILKNFHKWKKVNEIIENFDFIIYPRNKKQDFIIQKGMRFKLVKASEIVISSTQIRQKIKLKESISDYLPIKALSFIKENFLYL